MRLNQHTTLAAILATAGLAVPASAELFAFDTSFSTNYTTSINGVEVRYQQSFLGYAMITVLGDLTLSDGDTLYFTGDRPAYVFVLNNLSIAPGAQVNASASLYIPGPGGGGGGQPALPSGPGSFGGPGGIGGTWGAGGVGGVFGSGGTNGFPGITGTVGIPGGPTGSLGSTGDPGQPAYNTPGGAGAGGVTDAFADGDGALPGARGAGIAGGAGGAAGGGNGSPGRTGNPGGEGSNGFVGRTGGDGGHGQNMGDGFDLIGGAGGGGGAAGTTGSGGGGGGGAGGGSGGGGGGSDGAFSTGGLGGGGSGGTNGGRGGAGGQGGSGATGGGGGGAVWFHVLGHAELGGLLDVSGAESGDLPEPESGAPGQVGQFPSGPGNGGSGINGGGAGGRGGVGGRGGRGGDGGDGGFGGYGGGGAGGALILMSSVFVESTSGQLLAYGGWSWGAPGEPGRVAVADNVVGELLPAPVPAPATVVVGVQPGVLSYNPYGANSNPLIPDLVAGAEVYGLAPLTPADFPSVIANAPAGADLALVRLDVGPAPFDHDFIQSDFIAVINLSDDFISAVSMEISSLGGVLAERGTARRAAGAPAAPLAGLNPGEVWITLAEDDIYDFALSTPDATVSSATLQNGQAIYLIGASCLADFNNDDQVNFFDVSAYLAAYNAQDPSADVAPPTGVFNFFDVSAFISAYNAGCP